MGHPFAPKGQLRERLRERPAGPWALPGPITALLSTVYRILSPDWTLVRAVSPVGLDQTKQALEPMIIIAEHGLAEKLGSRIEPVGRRKQQAT